MEKTVTMSYAEHQALIRAKLCVVKLHYKYRGSDEKTFDRVSYKLCDNASDVREAITMFDEARVREVEAHNRELESIVSLCVKKEAERRNKWWKVWRRK